MVDTRRPPSVGPGRGGGADLRVDAAGGPKKKLRMANLSFGTRAHPVLRTVRPPVGSHYAMVARRHMHEFGTSIEQLAEVAVSARYNAGFNPKAYYRDPNTIDDVVDARGRGPADEAPLLHPHDGGGAIVLTHEERARDCARRRSGSRDRRSRLPHHHERVGGLHRVACVRSGSWPSSGGVPPRRSTR